MNHSDQLHPSLIFENKTRAFPSEVQDSTPLSGQAPNFVRKYKARLKLVANAKRSSLFRPSVNEKEKFCRIGSAWRKQQKMREIVQTFEVDWNTSHRMSPKLKNVLISAVLFFFFFFFIKRQNNLHYRS